jgi:transposase
MLEKRKEGILSRVEYPISTGPLEGLNNMIKVTKRVAYGYRDMEYFFLKLFDKSRHHIKHRTFKKVYEQRNSKNLV